MEGVPPEERDHEAEAALLKRLEDLERMVFGEDKAPPTAASYQEVHDLRSKVEGMAKHLGRVEGSSNRDLHHAVAQASTLGLLSPVTSSTPIADGVELKEAIILAARGEIAEMAKLFAQVKALEKHINPPYLRDIPEFSSRLDKAESVFMGQAADAAWIHERAEDVRLHYSQAVSLISEKFAHWDDQVAELERQRESSSSPAATAS